MILETKEVLQRVGHTMVLESDSFRHGEEIPSRHTCEGADVSPALSIVDPPENSVALALVVEDPDAPDGTFTHWTAWNLPLEATRIPEDADLRALGGVEGINDFGNVGYGGPCPPRGVHRYFFRVLALSELLDLDEGADVEAFQKAIRDRVVAWGEVMGTYEKKW